MSSEKAFSQLKRLNNRILNDRKIKLKYEHSKTPHKNKQLAIYLLTTKIAELENTRNETLKFIDSCNKKTEQYHQWRKDPLSIQLDDIPQIPILRPVEPEIHKLERIITA